MKSTTSIYLVDDHSVVRNGLKSLIESMGDYKVTGEFSNGKELVDSVPFNNQPNIIIMDLTMPVMDGTEAVRRLKELDERTPIVVLTLETTEAKIIELFRMGIRGYLPKSCTADILKKAIDDVVNTGYYHSEILVKALASGIKEGQSVKSALNYATDREIEFLRLVCDEQEYTYEQIASIMGVSRRTVDGYRESLFEKFNIKSKTGLVLFAIKYGVISIEKQPRV